MPQQRQLKVSIHQFNRVSHNLKGNAILSIVRCTRVHSALCPFGIVSIQDCLDLGFCPFAIVFVRNCVLGTIVRILRLLLVVAQGWSATSTFCTPDDWRGVFWEAWLGGCGGTFVNVPFQLVRLLSCCSGKGVRGRGMGVILRGVAGIVWPLGAMPLHQLGMFLGISLLKILLLPSDAKCWRGTWFRFCLSGFCRPCWS